MSRQSVRWNSMSNSTRFCRLSCSAAFIASIAARRVEITVCRSGSSHRLRVVPAEPGLWTVDPFAGEVLDGYLWGRGSIDMKHMVTMILTACAKCEPGRTAPARAGACLHRG